MSSILTPVQGIQIVIEYPNNITPVSVEPAPRFPDLIKTTINQETKTIFAMASVGQNGQSVTGAYPIFSVVFEGRDANFKIQKENTIVAANGQALEFNIISE